MPAPEPLAAALEESCPGLRPVAAFALELDR